MHRILIFLFISANFLCNLFAQTYCFNRSLMYEKSEEGNPTINRKVFVNSNDDSYAMTIYMDEDEFTAKITDFKSQKIHLFDITQKITGLDTLTTFSLRETKDKKFTKFDEYLKSFVYDYREILRNEQSKTVQFLIFKNSKKRKPIQTFDVQFELEETYSFVAVRYLFFHPYEWIVDMQYPEKGVVSYVKYITPNGKKFYIKLLEIKEIDFSIKVN